MHLPPDLQEFKNKAKLMFGGLFIPDREIHIARAPLRLDVMGGTADYSGSVILGSTLDSSVIAGIQKRRDMRILIKSIGLDNQSPNIVDYHFDFMANSAAKGLNEYAADLDVRKMPAWAKMVLGMLAILQLDGQAVFQNGMTLGIQSSIPLQTGINPGPALQAAVISALKSAYNLPFNAFQLTEFCLKTDHFTGIPGGIMSPLTSIMGKKNKLLAVRSQPQELLKMVSLDKNLKLIGIDCQLPAAPMAEQLRYAYSAMQMGKVILFDKIASGNTYKNYLANIPVSEWESQYQNLAPETIKGSDYLEQYGEKEQANPFIIPEMNYRVRHHTAFPIYENERVQQFIRHLEAYSELHNQDHLLEAGRLMTESGVQNRDAGPGDKVKFVLDYLHALGPEEGIYGARSAMCCDSGTIVVLADAQADDHIGTLVARYQDTFGSRLVLYRDSSAGALDQGVVISKL